MSSKDIDNEKMLQIKDFLENNTITNYCFLLESKDNLLSVFSENDPLKLYALLHSVAHQLMSVCTNTTYPIENNLIDGLETEIEIPYNVFKRDLKH